MAQLKRLTRRQKILLSKIRSGFNTGATTEPVDLDALEKHGLIFLGDDGRWKAVEQEEDNG